MNLYICIGIFPIPLYSSPLLDEQTHSHLEFGRKHLCDGRLESDSTSSKKGFLYFNLARNCNLVKKMGKFEISGLSDRETC